MVQYRVVFLISAAMFRQLVFVSRVNAGYSSVFYGNRLRIIRGGRKFSQTTTTMMPEGPEVRTVVDQLQGGVGRRLQGFKFLSGRYVRHGMPKGYTEFVESLRDNDNVVEQWNAKGKFIYLVLDGTRDEPDYRRSIWITLGMTGRFVSEKVMAAADPSSRDSLAWTRWTIALEDPTTQETTTIYYQDYRNFGTLRFSLSAEELDKKLKSLGPDILENDTDEDLFVEIVAAQKPELNVCKFLMNQSVSKGGFSFALLIR